MTTSHTGTTPKPCHPPVLCAIVFIPVNGKNGKGTIVKRHAVLEQVFDLDAKKHTHEIGMHSSSIMICVLPRTTANSSSWMEFVKIWLTRTHKFVPWSTRKNLCSSNYATDPFLTVISVNPQFVSGVCGILKIHACLPKVLFTKSLTTLPSLPVVGPACPQKEQEVSIYPAKSVLTLNIFSNSSW